MSAADDVYVTKNGYVTPGTQTKSVTKDATTSYSFTLSAVPPDTGSIEVTSDPVGAEIFINTVDTGFTTPYTFTGKVVGSYDVYVTKNGYVTPGTQTKSVTKDATTSYSFTLSAVPPDTGSIEVTSDPVGAEIFINTADTGFTTPYTFTGKVVGSYDVYVTKNGYVTPGTQTKSVTKDATTSYSFTLIPVSTLFDGPVTLANTNYTQYTYLKTGATYDVSELTPLGALHAASLLEGFTYDVTDKKLSEYGVMLLDNIRDPTGAWTYNYTSVKNESGTTVEKWAWTCAVNGEILTDSGTTALNTRVLTNGDSVLYYYGNTMLSGYTADDAVARIILTVDEDTGVDVIYNGPVTLANTNYTQYTYLKTGASYDVSELTPLGALHAASLLEGFTYDVTDKKLSEYGVMLLDNIRDPTGAWTYNYTSVKNESGTTVEKWAWTCAVNGEILTDSGTTALNTRVLTNGDSVLYYYGNTMLSGYTADDAVARIILTVDEDTGVDVIYNGPVTLANTNYTQYTYLKTGASYDVSELTPLGALHAASLLEGFTYDVTDKKLSEYGVMLLDNIRDPTGAWTYNYTSVKNESGTTVEKWAWTCAVNGEILTDSGTTALNTRVLTDGDSVLYYYGNTMFSGYTADDAVARIVLTVDAGAITPTYWTLSLSGAKNTTVSKIFFEQGLACPSSGHQVFWNDTEGNTWGGVPLWVLVSMVDDNPDVGPDHFNFNDSIAAQGYSVKVTSGDGWDTTLSSQNIARNNSIIVANTLNGQPLPLLTSAGKRSWPLHLKGEAVFGGQQVGNITSIQLTGLPQPPTEWTLTLEGDVTDTITQSFFIDAIACKHNVTWTDPSSGTVWQGVPLWDLAGAVDDIESSNHYTFNDTRATMGYTIRVSATDGFNATFASATAAHNDGFFVAYKMNGTPLTGTSAPLKLVGPATTSNKQRVGGIEKISLEGLPDQYPAGDWQLKLNGKISDVIPQEEFEYWALHHSATYTDTMTGNVYTGVPLWRLMGWVDDRIPHGPNGFDDASANAGYKVIVKAGDGYAKDFTSQQIGKTDAFIIANTMNGAPLPTDGSHPPYPLRLVGSGATGGSSVGNVVEIQLTDFLTPVDVPKLHIIKYAGDGTTIINETYVDYTYMESNLPVIGDGTTAYKFEGLTLNPSNLWDPEETYPGGYKISNVVKGSRVRDLAELVGGMGSGTTITFVATDGFETTLPYSSIYTNPAVQARQGDAIIAWWGDGQYVPKYADGMRLFFTPDGDHVYGQWDMHETLPSQVLAI